MKILSLITVLFLTVGVWSQEAKIKFEMNFETDDPQMEQQMAMMANSSMTMYMKDQKFRQETNIGNGLMVTTSIVDGETKKGVILMNGMMGKIASTFDADEEDEEADEEADVEIEFTDETKEILGFECKKAILYTADGAEMIYWYTEEIKAPEREQQYVNSQIPGMPLEFSIEQPQMTMTFKAVEYDDKVKKAKELFDTSIPEGYTEKSMEEIQQMTGR